ncbi:hypothetical protein EVG20_g111 [Dentipellis fragilis]|uniref:Uncharacterized protein n=1 Tax=Dentipellis fragilis TaxID=205917 RepID=A0A4Y9ZHH2_9AGAM|nr:hypothetical protein EVG20_g111 [Dentipellis fragilis]
MSETDDTAAPRGSRKTRKRDRVSWPRITGRARGPKRAGARLRTGPSTPRRAHGSVLEIGFFGCRLSSIRHPADAGAGAGDAATHTRDVDECSMGGSWESTTTVRAPDREPCVESAMSESGRVMMKSA